MTWHAPPDWVTDLPLWHAAIREIAALLGESDPTTGVRWVPQPEWTHR